MKKMIIITRTKIRATPRKKTSDKEDNRKTPNTLFWYKNWDKDTYEVIWNILEPFTKIHKIEEVICEFDMQMSKEFNTLIMKYAPEGKQYF